MSGEAMNSRKMTWDELAHENAALRADRDAAREERDEYRIEADKAIQDYDALELVAREAFEKIAQRTAIVTHTKTGVVYRSSPEWTGEGANRIAKEAIVAIEELETQHGGRLAAAEAREAAAVERAITLAEGGAGMIAVERVRQQQEEGWSDNHDNEHVRGEMAEAAACYALLRDDWWPWDEKWWKPSGDPIRNLVKAGALIAAEIDRLQRRALAAVSPEQPSE